MSPSLAGFLQRLTFFFVWHYSPWWILASSRIVLHCTRSCNFVYTHFPILEPSQQICFMGWGWEPHAQTPTWRNRVSLFVWVITFDLYGMDGPTSSYATASTTLSIISTHNPHHFVNVRITSDGLTPIFSDHFQHRPTVSLLAFQRTFFLMGYSEPFFTVISFGILTTWPNNRGLPFHCHVP